jgi:putative heme-binding domain-containing protein
VIKKGVPGADMPASNLEDDKLWQLVAFVRSINSPAVEQNVPGDARVGETVFWGKGGCSNCHLIRGKGGLLGPDLSNIGATQPVEQIRENILEPDIDGFESYRRVTATTRDGKTIAGVLRNRSNYSLQIQDEKGNLRMVATAGLREVTLEKSSPMPKDYKSRLGAGELRDLLAYLAQQSMRSAEDRKSASDEEKK